MGDAGAELASTELVFESAVMAEKPTNSPHAGESPTVPEARKGQPSTTLDEAAFRERAVRNEAIKRAREKCRRRFGWLRAPRRKRGSSSSRAGITSHVALDREPAIDAELVNACKALARTVREVRADKRRRADEGLSEPRPK
jgi:hypothetical protein